MNAVTVKKSKVIEALNKNREEFKKTYDIALEGYRLNVLNSLGGYLKEFKELDLYDIEAFPIVPHLDNKPQNHDEEFDMAIEMLELEEADTVTLTSREFKRYFKNQWEWYDSWAFSNSSNIGIGTDSPDSVFYAHGN